MGIIPILILLCLSFLFFYYYLQSTFVHFMNTFILVPPQFLINETIRAINVVIKGLNKPFNSLHDLSIEASLGKVFGKKLGFEITPFKKIIPKDMIPYVPSLKYKCINEPDGYKTIFNYSTPKQCPFYKKKHKKKKKKILNKTLSYFMNFVIVIMLILLLILIIIGHKKGIMIGGDKSGVTEMTDTTSSVSTNSLNKLSSSLSKMTDTMPNVTANSLSKMTDTMPNVTANSLSKMTDTMPNVTRSIPNKLPSNPNNLIGAMS